MPLKLNLGISKKIGQPDYGSLGAHCTLELELDCGLLKNLDAFQEKVRKAYAACRTAVDEELSQQQISTNGPSENIARPLTHSPAPTLPRTSPPATSNPPRNGHPPRPSSKQLDYLHRLSEQIPGLGPRKLESLAQGMFDKPLPLLSSFEASSFIDMLKQAKAGALDLSEFLEGARG